jgi:hypothetical protein
MAPLCCLGYPTHSAGGPYLEGPKVPQASATTPAQAGSSCGHGPLALLATGLVVRARHAVTLSVAFGLGLMVWICVQWVLLAGHLWLQPLMFGIGAVIAALSTIVDRRPDRDPGTEPLSHNQDRSGRQMQDLVRDAAE